MQPQGLSALSVPSLERRLWADKGEQVEMEERSTSKHQAASPPAQAEQPLFWCNRLVAVAAMAEHPSQGQLPEAALPRYQRMLALVERVAMPVMVVRCS